jgi:hypothetical protein
MAGLGNMMMMMKTPSQRTKEATPALLAVRKRGIKTHRNQHHYFPMYCTPTLLQQSLSN